MNHQQKTTISDWGIEDYIPSPIYTHFQPLRFINDSLFSHHSQTNSLTSSAVYRHDSITDTTSMASPDIDKDMYREFLSDYGMVLVESSDDNVFEQGRKLLIVGKTHLIQERLLMKQIMDQFNYLIITCDLLRNDTKLKYMRVEESNTPIIQKKLVQLVKFSIRIRDQHFKINLLLISMIRYLIRHRSNYPLMFIKLTISIMIKYSKLQKMSVRLKLNKMMQKMDEFMISNMKFDNKLISVLINETQRDGIKLEIAGQLGGADVKFSTKNHLIVKNGITLLIIAYNNYIKKLLPILDISCLEKYLNIYKLDFFNDDEMDFIWVLNNDQIFNETKDLSSLVKNYVIIRKFYLCCLLTMGEIVGNEEAMDKDFNFFNKILENKFNMKIETKFISIETRMVLIIEFLKLGNLCSNLNEQLDNDDMQLKKLELNLFEQKRSNSGTIDKLISRMDKISNNLRYLRYQGNIIKYDNQIGQDLRNLVELYNQTTNLRSMSNPIELKRYSMPSAIQKMSPRCHHHQKRSSSGLSFNLLTLVLEDTTTVEKIVSFDDNYIKMGVPRGFEEDEDSVIIHEMGYEMAQSTMLEDKRDDPDNEIQEEEEEEEVMTLDEMRKRLTSQFDRVFK